MGREWLTVEEIRVELKVHAMTVYRLIKGGRLGAVKVGRSYRVSRKDFEAYLREARIDVPRAGRAGAQAPELPAQRGDEPRREAPPD